MKISPQSLEQTNTVACSQPSACLIYSYLWVGEGGGVKGGRGGGCKQLVFSRQSEIFVYRALHFAQILGNPSDMAAPVHVQMALTPTEHLA